MGRPVSPDGTDGHTGGETGCPGRRGRHGTVAAGCWRVVALVVHWLQFCGGEMRDSVRATVRSAIVGSSDLIQMSWADAPGSSMHGETGECVTTVCPHLPGHDPRGGRGTRGGLSTRTPLPNLRGPGFPEIASQPSTHRGGWSAASVGNDAQAARAPAAGRHLDQGRSRPSPRGGPHRRGCGVGHLGILGLVGSGVVAAVGQDGRAAARTFGSPWPAAGAQRRRSTAPRGQPLRRAGAPRSSPTRAPSGSSVTPYGQPSTCSGGVSSAIFGRGVCLICAS